MSNSFVTKNNNNNNNKNIKKKKNFQERPVQGLEHGVRIQEVRFFGKSGNKGT